MQFTAAAKLYVPAGQGTAVLLGDPGGHMYPAAQGPLQELFVSPPTPNRPASQGPVQADEVIPAVSPNLPGLQGWHTPPRPPALNVPGGHIVPCVAVAAPWHPYPAGVTQGVHEELPPRENVPGSHGWALLDRDVGTHQYPAWHVATDAPHCCIVTSMEDTRVMEDSHVGASPSSRLEHRRR